MLIFLILIDSRCILEELLTVFVSVVSIIIVDGIYWLRFWFIVSVKMLLDEI